MCGKSVVPKSRRYEELAAKYGVTLIKIDEADCDVERNPSDWIHVLMDWKEDRCLVPMIWGFQNHGGLFNARSDSIDKPTWINSFKFNRCVVPVESFYEKQMQFRHPDGETLLLAGIYGVMEEDHTWRVAILTTEANPLVATSHDRMPVIMPSEGVAPWLSSAYNENAAPLLGAFTEHSKDAKLVVV